MKIGDESNIKVMSLKNTSRWYVLTSDFRSLTWKQTILTAIVYFLYPIIVPITIILSKVLNKKIELFGFDSEVMSEWRPM